MVVIRRVVRLPSRKKIQPVLNRSLMVNGHSFSTHRPFVFTPGNDLLSPAVARAAPSVEIASGKDQAAFGLGDGAAELLGGFDPLFDDDLNVLERLPACFPIGGAAGQFGYFRDERAVLRAPVDNDLVSLLSG